MSCYLCLKGGIQMRKNRVFAVIAAALLLTACAGQQPETTLPAPTETEAVLFDGRSPWDFTWEEFERMQPGEQMAFQASFGSTEAFEQWRLSAMPERIEIPWENGGKEPAAYTLDEFDALSGTLQVLFENSFPSRSDFEAWRQNAQYDKYDVPWADGGKAPADYTWAEFEALTAEQQILFQNSFDSIEAFDRWLTAAQEDTTEVDLGDRELDEITWEEFEAMSAQEQMAFQNAFESLEDFDRWLRQAQSGSSDLPWDNGGKQPEEYTWAEFEALAPDLQIIFQSSFATEDGFEQWLMANMPQ